MSAPSLAEILLANAFLSLTVDNKIFCSITKHEMPPKADAVLGHINGKKFKKTKEWYSYDYSEFEPYIVPDRQNATKLHCKLTGQTLNKIPEEVKKHCAGKKFIRLKAENEVLQKKQEQNQKKERDTNPDIWVPPEELLEEDEEEAAPAKGEKGKASKGSKEPTGAKEIEEDTFSDLLGSDHGDELDEGDDEEEDFDEVEESEGEMEVTETVAKKATKGKAEKKIPEKAQAAGKKVEKKVEKKAEKVQKVLKKVESIETTKSDTKSDKVVKRKADVLEVPAAATKKSKSDNVAGKKVAAPKKK